VADEYTPTTDEIRKGYIGEPDHFMDPLVGAEFDRWLADERAKAVTDFAALVLPTDLYRKAQEHANTIREGGKG
jgi:hypothetical protein